MKQYKFVGDYKKLKKLGYERLEILELFDPQYQMWCKVGNDHSICIFDHISVKAYSNGMGITYSSPNFVEPFIKDLIQNKLVEIVEDEEE